MRVVLLAMAWPYIKSHHTAIDGGAYKGEWTERLSKRFSKVYAFEPQTLYATKLTQVFPNVTVVNAALMDKSGTGTFITPPPRPSGKPVTDRSATVIWQKNGVVPIVKLDDFPIEQCGLIKLNIEGGEPFALEGARGILERDNPVVIMEEADPVNLPDQYKDSPQKARSLLESLRYRQVACYKGHDTVWSKGL